MIEEINEISMAILRGEDPTELIDAAAAKYGVDASSPSEDEMLISAREINMAGDEDQSYTAARNWLRDAVALKNSYTSADDSESTSGDVESSQAV